MRLSMCELHNYMHCMGAQVQDVIVYLMSKAIQGMACMEDMCQGYIMTSSSSSSSSSSKNNRW